MAPETLNGIHVDGSLGEGGGQILRTALALSTCTRQSFHMTRIRSARKNPGLQPQHLAAVRAASAISQAEVEGDEKDSQTLLFKPAKVTAGQYHFSVGTAGSTSLVLQTVLPALMRADSPSQLVLEGGTHNPLAPSFDFLEHSFIPLVNRMGPTVTVTLERPGFAPRGGGRVLVNIQPCPAFRKLEIVERGRILTQYAEVLLAHLPTHIAQRELSVLKREFEYRDNQLRSRLVQDAYGPGNVVNIYINSEHISECFTAFGQPGLPAENVATGLVSKVRRYLDSGVPVGPYLADQLLLPMAMAAGGMFVTLQPSSHMLTAIEVIRIFIRKSIELDEIGHDMWKIRIS